ncbi:hypothetical protein NQZ68_001303, partial [Dissostichus eleginoides]
MPPVSGATVRERLALCVRSGPGPQEPEGIQSTVRTATSGRPADSWLPHMMHWAWHPNWPQCLSQGA